MPIVVRYSAMNPIFLSLVRPDRISSPMTRRPAVTMPNDPGWVLLMMPSCYSRTATRDWIILPARIGPADSAAGPQARQEACQDACQKLPSGDETTGVT